MKVIIDGVEYVPKAEVKELTDKSLKECLEVLTSMRHFNQQHKMKAHAWDAINALSPDLAKLDEKEAYDFIHGAEE
jgi:chorismate mutase